MLRSCGCRREAGERVCLHGGCVYMCALPSEAGMLGLPLHRSRERGKGAREECTGHRFSLSIRGMPRGTGPLICHRSFVLTVKEPTLFFFHSLFSPSCYRNCCVYRLCFVTIPMNFRSGFSALIHQLFPHRAAVEFA